MNIFDAHVSGSLSVSGSSDFSGNLNVSLGTISGSFKGDGSQIVNIPASGVTGLNLTQIADGTATASISQTNGFNVNTDINVSGSILPSVNAGDNVSVHSLGSSTNAWNHLYISTGSIKFVNDLGLEQGRITINPNSGQFNILNTSGLTQNEIDQIELGNVPSASLSDISIKSLDIYDSIVAGGSVTASAFTGSFKGDGQNLYGIPASGVTGLNLTQIADGSATASISNTNGLRVNSNTEITGSLNLNNLSLGVDTVISNTVTDSAGKYYINGIKNPVLTFIKGFKYRFYNSNNGTHPFLFSTTNDGEHNGGVTYTVGVTENVSPYYIEIEVTKDTPTTLYYYCDHHVGMGNSISITNDVLNNVANTNIIYIDPTRIATTGSNTFVGAQNVSGSVNLTGSLNITGSISLNGVPVGTGKLDETTFNSYTSSNDLTSSTQNDKLTSLETSTGSLNTFTGSIDTTIKNKLDTESVISGSIQVEITGTTGYSTFSSSIDLLSSSVATTTLNVKNRVDSIETSTGSLNSFTSSINTTIKDKMNADGVLSGSITFDISVIPGFTGLTNTVSSSISSSVSELSGSLTLTVTNLSSSLTNTDENQNNRITSLETASGSLNSFTSSINTTIKSKLNTEGVISGSVQVSLTDTTGYSTFSSSIATTDLNQNNRLNSIENSYATTGSNRFNGNQTITGSLVITQNLQVLGSSSIVYSTASQLIVEDNIIVVNASYPAERFAGIEVHDSGSNGSVTASLFWDGLNNRWIYRNTSDAHYGGAMFIAGPRNTGSLGDEPGLTSGKLPKSIGGDHIGDSIMNETNDSIYITGSLSATGTVYGTNITAIETSTSSLNTFTSSIQSAVELTGSNLTIKGNLLVKGTTTNVNTTTLDVDNNLINLNGTGATSAGLRVKDTTGPNQVSGSLLWDATNDYWVAGQLGSEQRLVRETEFNNAVTRISGIELSTGSLNSFTSSINTTIKSKLNTDGVISGSAQITGLSNSQLTNSSITIAGTSTALGGTISAATIGNAIGSFSGSAQIALTGTTGFGTYLNQAVLSTSSPTFAAVTATSGTQSTSLNYNTSAGVVALKSDIATAGTYTITVGKAASTNNAANFRYNHAGGDGSTSNFVGVGFWGNDDLFKVYATGNATLSGNLTTTGTISGSTIYGTWNGSAIGNSYLANSSFYLGSTSISLGRASATLNLSGVNTDGYAASLNGYSNQTLYTILDGPANGPVIKVRYDSATTNRYIDIGSKDGNGVYTEGLKIYNGGTLTFATYTVYHSGNVPTWNQNTTGTAANITASSNTSLTSLANLATVGTISTGVWNGSSISTTYTAAKVTAVNAGTGVGVDTTTGSVTVSIGQAVATSSSPTFADLTLSGGFTVGGSLSRGTYTTASNYVSGADNIVLKGNGSGVSGIFFESETNGTNINHPSDFGFIQFHPYGIGGSSGEANRLVIGVSNDADDMIVLNPMATDGIKVRIGAGTTEYTVKHTGNSSYSTTFSSVTSVTVTHSLGTKDVAVFVYDSSDNMFWPSSIVTTSTSVVTITFASSRSGRVVVVR